MKFLPINNKIVNLNTIKMIDCSTFLIDGIAWIHYIDSTAEPVYNLEALSLIMLLSPSVLEGKRGKYWKHQWAVHNLIAHPVMQLLSFVGLTKYGLWVHDKTVPKPQISEK